MRDRKRYAGERVVDKSDGKGGRKRSVCAREKISAQLQRAAKKFCEKGGGTARKETKEEINILTSAER